MITGIAWFLVYFFVGMTVAFPFIALLLFIAACVAAAKNSIR
jgi:hypothetical protein